MRDTEFRPLKRELLSKLQTVSGVMFLYEKAFSMIVFGDLSLIHCVLVIFLRLTWRLVYNLSVWCEVGMMTEWLVGCAIINASQCMSPNVIWDHLQPPTIVSKHYGKWDKWMWIPLFLSSWQMVGIRVVQVLCIMWRRLETEAGLLSAAGCQRCIEDFDSSFLWEDEPAGRNGAVHRQ